jgi:hypothetical protein
LSGVCQGTARYGGTQYCNNPNFVWDENQNRIGSYSCWTDCDCDGMRTCTSENWCDGIARQLQNSSECNKTRFYTYDESIGYDGKGQSTCNTKNNSCECNGLRLCDYAGYCQGTALEPVFETSSFITINILQNIDNTVSKSGTDDINLSFQNSFGDQLGCKFKLSNKGVKTFEPVILRCTTSLDIYLTADSQIISNTVPCYSGIHTVLLPFTATTSEAATVGVDLVDYAANDVASNEKNPVVQIGAETVASLFNLAATQNTGTRSATYAMMATVLNNGTSIQGIEILDSNCSKDYFSYGRILRVTGILFLSCHLLILVI